MASRQVVFISTVQSWQQAVLDEHRKSCPHATLHTMKLKMNALAPQPVKPSKSLDAVLDALNHLVPSWPANAQPSRQPDQGMPVGHEEPPSKNLAFQKDEEQAAPKEETAFDTTQRIVAGQCTCCNTLFQLEILEKVGTIDNANAEFQKLQAPAFPLSFGSAALSGKEAYGTVFETGRVDYAPKSQGEVMITYTITGTYQ